MILSVVFFVSKKMSKGSKRRPEDKKKIDENWDKIFVNEKNKKRLAQYKQTIVNIIDEKIEKSLQKKANKLHGRQD